MTQGANVTRCKNCRYHEEIDSSLLPGKYLEYLESLDKENIAVLGLVHDVHRSYPLDYSDQLVRYHFRGRLMLPEYKTLETWFETEFQNRCNHLYFYTTPKDFNSAIIKFPIPMWELFEAHLSRLVSVQIRKDGRYPIDEILTYMRAGNFTPVVGITNPMSMFKLFNDYNLNFETVEIKDGTISFRFSKHGKSLIEQYTFRCTFAGDRVSLPLDVFNNLCKWNSEPLPCPFPSLFVDRKMTDFLNSIGCGQIYFTGNLDENTLRLYPELYPAKSCSSKSQAYYAIWHAAWPYGSHHKHYLNELFPLGIPDLIMGYQNEYLL